MKNIISILIVSVGLQTFAWAGEGMWLPWLISVMQEQHMQQKGMKMSKEDIYDVNRGSLKDAIVSFGGFCTGEVISGEGLLLTNHHCGYGQIQNHSTVENNYLEDGFWASTRAEELPNPGLTATFIDRVDDVTKVVLTGVTNQMSPAERQAVIDVNINGVIEKVRKEDYQEVFVRGFYEGEQYFLFVTNTYQDVRLVGAPPSSIGKFGSDTDNWMWPRHTGDFSLFRIYADSNNLPAAYSPDNIPYTPKHFLPISMDGVEAGDFTLVFGFPGRTQSYLPSEAVKQTVDVLNPARIALRERALKIVDGYMRSDEQIRIQYASKYASIANYWKKWIGESQGLQATGAIEKKQQQEKRYLELIAKDEDWSLQYGGVLDDLNQMYLDMEDYALAQAYYSEVFNRNVELFRIAGYLNRLVTNYESGGEHNFNNFRERLRAYLPGFYKNYNAEIDREVFAALVEMYVMNMPIGEAIKPIIGNMQSANDKDFQRLAQTLYGNTSITDLSGVTELMDGEPDEVVAAIQQDPLLSFAADVKQAYDQHIRSVYNQRKAFIDENQRLYTKSLLLATPSRIRYPDANSTLRYTYGQVEGYQSFDESTYEPHTYLSGVIEKYKPGDYEFDVPQKLRSLYQQKDFGPYKAANGDVPVCFIGSNHTTGGNSGSPALDAYGNLIGLNFDRVWEGTMSDINYDVTYCRNIMVDVRYVLFIIDKFADAGHLLEEMKLVYPKSNPASLEPIGVEPIDPSQLKAPDGKKIKHPDLDKRTPAMHRERYDGIQGQKRLKKEKQ